LGGILLRAEAGILCRPALVSGLILAAVVGNDALARIPVSQVDLLLVAAPQAHAAPIGFRSLASHRLVLHRGNVRTATVVPMQSDVCAFDGTADRGGIRLRKLTFPARNTLGMAAARQPQGGTMRRQNR
jgi:hypothetical protein